MTAAITSFRKTILSNFEPCEIWLDHVRYSSVEHAYQAAKTLDLEARKAFTLNTPAAEAKRHGRKLKLRADWEDVKLDVMRECVRSKFTRNTQLGGSLLATFPADLQEGNTWGDRIWGQVLAQWESTEPPPIRRLTTLSFDRIH